MEFTNDQYTYKAKELHAKRTASAESRDRIKDMEEKALAALNHNQEYIEAHRS